MITWEMLTTDYRLNILVIFWRTLNPGTETVAATFSKGQCPQKWLHATFFHGFYIPFGR